TRNHRLNVAAFSLGQIVAAGGLDEREVRDRLFEAAEACGLVADDGAQQVWATIASGITAGAAQPRSRPQRQLQSSSQPSSQQSAQTQSAQASPQQSSQPQQQPAPQSQPPGPQPSPQPQPRALPIIRLTEGRLPHIVDDVETILIAAGGRDLYQRGELVVRPIKSKLKAANDRDTFGWQLIPVTTP